MATEEIEISELELAEELAPDSLIPIESLTDTKATTLQKIKEWLSSFFVGKTGNEIIQGDKEFRGILRGVTRFILKGKGMHYNKAPSTQQVVDYRVVDAEGQEIGNFRISNDTDDTNRASINVRGRDGSFVYFTLLNKNGKGWAECPIPPTDDNSKKIATTSWVRSSGAVITNKSFGSNGYIKFSGGLIIQWGVTDQLDSRPVDVTLPTPFETSGYRVATSNYYNTITNGASTIAYTTTGFRIHRTNLVNVTWIAVGK